LKQVHVAVGVLAIAATGATGLWGAWCWWRVRTSVWFWRLLRAGQALIVLQALLGGVLVLIGHKPPGLHVLYGVLPLLVSFLGEQLRIGTAQTVLDGRGFSSAADVARLPEDEQRVVALTIVQREMGVMALTALVIVVLLARAAMTAG